MSNYRNRNKNTNSFTHLILSYFWIEYHSIIIWPTLLIDWNLNKFELTHTFLSDFMSLSWSFSFLLLYCVVFGVLSLNSGSDMSTYPEPPVHVSLPLSTFSVPVYISPKYISLTGNATHQSRRDDRTRDGKHNTSVPRGR